MNAHHAATRTTLPLVTATPKFASCSEQRQKQPQKKKTETKTKNRFAIGACCVLCALCFDWRVFDLLRKAYIVNRFVIIAMPNHVTSREYVPQCRVACTCLGSFSACQERARFKTLTDACQKPRACSTKCPCDTRDPSSTLVRPCSSPPKL